MRTPSDQTELSSLNLAETFFCNACTRPYLITCTVYEVNSPYGKHTENIPRRVLVSHSVSPTNFSQEWGQVMERVGFPLLYKVVRGRQFSDCLSDGLGVRGVGVRSLAVAFFYCLSGGKEGRKSHLTRARLTYRERRTIVTVQAILNKGVGRSRFL